jgi:hypothetical protein
LAFALADEVRRDERREQPDDDQQHQELDLGESGLGPDGDPAGLPVCREKASIT